MRSLKFVGNIEKFARVNQSHMVMVSARLPLALCLRAGPQFRCHHQAKLPLDTLVHSPLGFFQVQSNQMVWVTWCPSHWNHTEWSPGVHWWAGLSLPATVFLTSICDLTGTWFAELHPRHLFPLALVPLHTVCCVLLVSV